MAQGKSRPLKPLGCSSETSRQPPEPNSVDRAWITMTAVRFAIFNAP